MFGLCCSVHAGEDYGPESIFQAITDLHAERIGHGYHIFSHELVDPQKVAQGLNPVRYVEELANYATNRCVSQQPLPFRNQSTPLIGVLATNFTGALRSRSA